MTTIPHGNTLNAMPILDRAAVLDSARHEIEIACFRDEAEREQLLRKVDRLHAAYVEGQS